MRRLLVLAAAAVAVGTPVFAFSRRRRPRRGRSRRRRTGSRWAATRGSRPANCASRSATAAPSRRARSWSTCYTNKDSTLDLPLTAATPDDNDDDAGPTLPVTAGRTIPILFGTGAALVVAGAGILLALRRRRFVAG